MSFFVPVMTQRKQRDLLLPVPETRKALSPAPELNGGVCADVPTVPAEKKYGAENLR
ncbi:MAG: hypothetical protein ABI167_04000 [Nitrosospira sp.]